MLFRSKHYSYHTCFFDSTLACFPGRSCEATFDRLMKCVWLDGSNGFKERMEIKAKENFYQIPIINSLKLQSLL